MEKHSLKALKEKLNKIPDDVLENFFIGLYEGELALVWEDGSQEMEEQFEEWCTKHPELEQVANWASSNKYISQSEEEINDFEEEILKFKE